MRASTASREAYFLEYACEIRQRVSIPLMLTGGLRTASVMSQVVAGGHVDMVGLARPIALEPELPQRILDGEVESAISSNPWVGIKMLDSLLSLEWSLRQMRRMSVGLEPKPISATVMVWARSRKKLLAVGYSLLAKANGFSAKG